MNRQIEEQQIVLEGNFIETGTNLPAIIQYAPTFNERDPSKGNGLLTSQELSQLYYILLQVAGATVEGVKISDRLGRVVICEFYPRAVENPLVFDRENRLDPVLPIPLMDSNSLTPGIIRTLRRMMQLQQDWVKWGGLTREYADSAHNTAQKLIHSLDDIGLYQVERRFFELYLYDIVGQPHKYLPALSRGVAWMQSPSFALLVFGLLTFAAIALLWGIN